MKAVMLIKMYLNEDCNEVRIGDNLSDPYPIRSEQGFTLEYVVRKVHKHQEAV
jgi:hypothetical protein